MRRTALWSLKAVGVRLGCVVAALACVTAVLAASSGPSAVSGPAAQTAGTQRPIAVVYRGPASCAGCAESVASLLRRSPLDFRVAFIGPGERRRLSPAGLRGADLYVQPGGGNSVDRAMRAIGRKGARAIRSHVAGGGRYLGFCMGAYLAGSGPGMGLLRPGNTDAYNRTRGALVKGPEDAVIPVRWRGTRRYQFAQDPPYIIASGVRGERVLSRFTNGRINALVRPYRRGTVAVVGTHPEAERSWYTRRLWRRDHDGLDRRQAQRLVTAVMRY